MPSVSSFMRSPAISAISCAPWRFQSRFRDWPLSSLGEKLIKIGAKLIRHVRYVAFQMAVVAIPKMMFAEVLRLIIEHWPQPPTASA